MASDFWYLKFLSSNPVFIGSSPVGSDEGRLTSTNMVGPTRDASVRRESAVEPGSPELIHTVVASMITNTMVTNLPQNCMGSCFGLHIVGVSCLSPLPPPRSLATTF